jgi:WS/DGAT/MGAT family acyltransferase
VSRQVDRISPGDAVQLATDVGPVPMNVGALLVLEGTGGVHGDAVVAALGRRAARVPRLRQRLVDAPWGLGRPYWVAEPSFDPAAHLAHVRSPDPGDPDALLRIATDAVTRPLPRSRPLWRALVVSGLPEGRVGVVIALHHTLADGIGGLALLGDLAGRGTDEDVDPPVPPAVPAPTRRTLAVDSARERLARLRALPRALARVRRGGRELGVARGPGAPRCSLNAPTGRRRRITAVTVDLAPVRDGARRHGATVNDALLVATTGAMDDVLRSRGERLPVLVVSVPVSARRSTTPEDLGNQVGVMPVRVPLAGPAAGRLEQVAALTRARKARTRGASASVVGPAFRALAALGVFRWFVDRQRLVNTFLTNLPGPPQRLTLVGAPVLEIVPVTVTAGNVAVAFAALSYAGRLTVSIVHDPDLVPDPGPLADALRARLEEVARS